MHADWQIHKYCHPEFILCWFLTPSPIWKFPWWQIFELCSYYWFISHRKYGKYWFLKRAQKTLTYFRTSNTICNVQYKTERDSTIVAFLINAHLMHDVIVGLIRKYWHPCSLSYDLILSEWELMSDETI